MFLLTTTQVSDADHNGVFTTMMMDESDTMIILIIILIILILIPLFLCIIQTLMRFTKWLLKIGLYFGVALCIVIAAMIIWQIFSPTWLKDMNIFSKQTQQQHNNQIKKPISIYSEKPEENSEYVNILLKDEKGRDMYYRMKKWQYDVDSGGPWKRIVKAIGNFDTTRILTSMATDLAWKTFGTVFSVPMEGISIITAKIKNKMKSVGEKGKQSECGSVCAISEDDCPAGVRCMCFAKDLRLNLTYRLLDLLSFGDKVMGTQFRPCLSPAVTSDNNFVKKIGFCECGGGGDINK